MAATRRAKTGVARRKGSKPPVFTPAFAPQRATAGARELLRFDMERARAAVRAAIQGMGAATANRPVAPGRWSPREIVLHLAVRDRVRLEEFAAVLAGTPASWMHMDHADMGPMNESHLAPLRKLSWDDAVRLMEANRERLLAALLTVPAEPEAVFGPEHPFGAMMRELPRHDRHHAEQIKQARISS
jgi:hypothetical protein